MRFLLGERLRLAIVVLLGSCTNGAILPSSLAQGATPFDEETVDAGAELKLTVSNWHGFDKQSFRLAGHSAFVVEPKVAAPGNPWIWRTSFPDFHSEVDRELAHNGFHIGFIDVVKMLGSDGSLDVMDQFYDHVRQHWGLAARPALYPCSRGGLHAYRYAARHPNRVACIFGDVPVMDLKSWPLQWKGSQQQVQDALRYYGFASVQELEAWKGNPIDLLQPIARSKIPLRHAVCLNDAVVPPEQNSIAAKTRLQELGHDLDLVVIEHSDLANGHHFPMPEVFGSSRFMMKHASVMPSKNEYFTLRSGLANSVAAFESKHARVAFLGGSITHNPGWRDELMRYFQAAYPDTKFDFIAAGIPSVGSNGHAFRLARDVLMRGKVDLVFVEAAVNDGSNIPGQGELMLRSMEGVVHQLRSVCPTTDIVQMHFAAGPQLDAYSAGEVPLPILQHERVAEHYGCTSLNITHEVADRIAAGEFTWQSGFKSNVHPPAFGQRLYSNSMTRMLDAALATTQQPEPHQLPTKLLDPFSYIDGRFGPLNKAKQLIGFSLQPKWQPTKGRTREGFADVPALVASAPGAEFSYEFEGTAFGLFLAAGYDTCVVEVTVDGGQPRQVDTFTRWSKSLHLPWPIMLADGLGDGMHVIKVRTTNVAKERTALHVIKILLN
ncbi:MAG: hypothetical protein Aurels2KO_03970 [Aureliella sp.]